MSSEFSQQLMGIVSTRLAEHIWSIRDSSLQAYLGSHASGRVNALTAKEQSIAPDTQGAIAIFRIEGVLVPKAEWFGEVGTFALAQAIQAAARNDDIRAGIFLINSPGGICHGMHELIQATSEFAAEKKLVTHVDGCCCSCAYELASQSHEIFAGPRDDVGSIGTRSLIYDFSKYFEDLGIEAVSTDTGPIKSLGVMGTAVTEEQRSFLRRRVDFMQGDMQDAVMRGRDMTAEKFATVATGEYWFGEQALGLGLIDGVHSSFQQTFAGVESAISKTVVSKGSNPMADQATKTDEPQAATTADLKKTFPNSTAECAKARQSRSATMAEAAVAYAQFQEQEAEKARAERDDAKAEAEKAAQEATKKEGTPGKSSRGVPAVNQQPGGADADPSSGPLDFHAMVNDRVEQTGCTRREAMRAIKKKHGAEAAKAFLRGSLEDSPIE